MSNEKLITALSDVVQDYKAVNIKNLLRPFLAESLKDDLEPHLNGLEDKLDIILTGSANIPQNILEETINNFTTLIAQMNNQAGLDTTQYLQNRRNAINNISKSIKNIENLLPHFTTGILLKLGVLEQRDISSELDSAIQTLKAAAAVTIKDISEESHKSLSSARELSNEIENKARTTARKISIEDAQKQFNDAQKDHFIQIVIWSTISVISIVVFFIIAGKFYVENLSELLASKQELIDYKWLIIYKTSMRIVILTAIGAISAFALKILRAQLHMREHNLHRQRLANSIGSFVESATNAEQRDLILAHLVNAISSFGSSGLLQKENDSIYAPQITVDNITKNLTSRS